MISTVTTVTTTTASVGTTATSLVSGFGLIATITLITLLIAKELVGVASVNSPASVCTMPATLDRVLNVGIIPLIMVFGSIVLVKILNVL